MFSKHSNVEIYHVENQAEVKKRSIFSRILSFIKWSVLIILFLLLGMVVLVFVYEKEVKAAILKELNKHLKVQVKVAPEDIDLTIIKSFPECGLQFSKVLAVIEKDTLLYGDRLSLRFDVMDLLEGKYDIHKIVLEKGLIDLRVDKEGKANYIFWDNTGAGTGNTAFDLTEIKVKQVQLRYLNREAGIKTDCFVQDLVFSGHFRDADYDLKVKGDLLSKYFKRRESTFLKNRKVALDFSLAVNGNRYQVKKASVKVNSLKLDLGGQFVYGERLENLKIDFSAPDFKISEVLSLVPKAYMPVSDDYSSEGRFFVNGRYEYSYPKKFNLKCDFGIKNGIITYKPNNISATQVNCNGTLRYDQSTSLLNLKDLSLNLNGDELKANCSINNFNDPYLDLQADAKLKLENLLAFWPIDTLQELRGKLQLRSEISGLLSDLKRQTFSPQIKMNLDAAISDLEVKFKRDPKSYFVENCQLISREREINVKDLRLKRGNSDMELNGSIPGLFNYLVDKSAPLIIDGTLASKNINLEDFLSTTGNSNSESALIPSNVRFSLAANVGHFSFGKFEASNISGDVEVKNQKAVINEVHLNTMGGKAELNVFVDNSGKKIEMTLQSSISQIDVKEMFRQMNNFGQSTLQDKHLKGLLTASVDFSASWNNKLIVDEKSIESQCKILIERGELIDFEPLLALSRFVSLDDLKRIKFSTLQSDISISDRIIKIPSTSIKNSALNIDVWGTHTFDNMIDYHLRLLTSEYYWKKRKKQDSEFGPVENDPENRRMAFIRMKGPIDNPEITYDRKGMKEKIKEDIQKEKKTVKQILHEEFGLFKKDSVIKEPVKKPTFEIENPEHPPKKKPLELEKKKEDEDF